jgi:hypothetical protein
MGAIPFEEVRAGMVLERDVVIAPDRLLLARGVTLTGAHITLLRVWGVTEVDVRGMTRGGVLDELAQGVAPERRLAIEAEVADLFCRAGEGHPAIDELRYLVTSRRLRREATRDENQG